jgi:cytochrome P450
VPKYHAYTDNDAAPWEKMAADRLTCPVAHFSENDGFNYFQVSTYALVREVSRQHKIYLNAPGVVPRGAEPEEEQVLTFADPPRHTRQRKLIGRAFSAARVDRCAGLIQEVADDLVDAIAEQDSRTFQLKRAFSRPLPARIISEILGVPVGDRDRFLHWAEVGEAGLGDAKLSEEQAANQEAFLEYCRSQFRLRINHPTDDLLSTIINAEEEGERMTEIEGAAMVRLLLSAGVGTTAIGISNLFWLIESNPDQKRRLFGNFEGLAASAVEEGFRFDCPVQGNFRGVGQSTLLGGHALSKGDRVFMLLSAANHDPDCYERPDEFIVDRKWESIPRHFAFGFGIHFCVGADLARLETQIALKTLYRRLPNLRILEGFVPEQVPGMVFRTWRELEMVYDGPVGPRLSPRGGT